jgi:autotransporter-associated beta strand protein
MVDKSRTLAIVLFAIVTGSAVPTAMAVDPPDLFLDELAPFVWTGAGGNNSWQTPGNWTAPAFPGDYPYTIPTIPNDPGRVDTNAQLISPSVGADLSGALVADRTVNLTADTTVASLKLGGTGVAVTTNVTATAPAKLIFENQEFIDNLTNPGDVNVDPDILPEPIYSFNQGRSLIWSTGTAGVGKENRISADIQFNDAVDVEGDRDLHLYGTLFEGPSDEIAADPTPTQAAPLQRRPSSISSLLSGGARLYIHGDINVPLVDNDPVEAGNQERPFNINSFQGVEVPLDPQMPPADPPSRQGIIDISGQFVGDGWVAIGSGDSSRVPLGSVILRADNVGDMPAMPVFTGRTVVNRGNLVLAHNNVFGGGDVTTGNPSTGVGFNFISDNDNRVISTPMLVAQWQTVRGATGIAGLESIGDHSIKFSGRVTLTNSRGWINLLPAGELLTLSGPQYALEEQDVDNLDHHRQYTMDGSGRTLISGGIHNRVPEQAAAGLADFRKSGTGTVVIDYDETNMADTPSDYLGHTYVQGGNLHFATAADLPDGYSPNSATSSEMLSSGGAVGLDTGLFTAGGALTADGTTFLRMFNNSANLNAPNSTSPSSFLRLYGVRDVITNRFDQGGLMLGAGDYDKDLNFSGSQASNPLAHAANMSLAAHEGGSTYTGTITPASASTGSPQPGATNPTGIAVGAETYRLGGGSGALTLPLNNQLTGNRNLIVTNGGEVRLTGTHNYTGTTQIMLNRETTNQFTASVDDPSDSSTPDPTIGERTGTTLRRNTTLTVSTLANGGQLSSIGNSSSAASNLVVHGSTLKYVGAAVSTDRLFTVGTAGGTIDASGTGPLTLSSTAALGIDVAEDRKGYLVGGLPNSDNNEVIGVPGVIASGLTEIIPFDTSDLVTGMVIKDKMNLGGGPKLVDDDSPLVVTSVGQNLLTVGETDLEADNDSSTEPPVPWPGYAAGVLDVATFEFGPAPARFLGLTGSNTGNNTLNPLVTDASDINKVGFDGALGGKGSVGIRKQGDGKWILTSANTYSGATNVDDGTLLINGTQTGTGLTTVASGAAFGGTGQIGGGLTMLEGSIFTATAVGGVIDALNVVGNVDLSALGNLLSVTGPITGTQTLLTFAGTLNGTFESSPGFTVNYLANSITISAGGALIGDYNNDGKVNAADYTVWRDNLGAPGSVLGANRDPLNGGAVSSADYASWKANFGQGAGSGSFGSAAVPEPTSFVLFAMALVGGACSRSRKS